MAKSWGARIVGRLFGSRSDKKADAEGNETSSLEGPVEDSFLRHGSEPYDDLPAKDSEIGLNRFEPAAREKTAPIEESSKAESNVGRPDKLEMQALPVQPSKENAGELATPLSSSAPMQKPCSVGIPKSQRGRLTAKASGVGEVTAAVETSNGKSSVSTSGRKRKPNHGAQRKVTNEVPAKGPGNADIKAPTDTKSENRIDELVSANDTVATKKMSRHGDLLKVGQESKMKFAAPKAEFSSIKRSRTQKPKAMDEQVTDEELAELEAENIRLKHLLHYKLQTNIDSIDNK